MHRIKDMSHNPFENFGVVENVDLAPYTTFGVKAVARYFVEVASTDALKSLLTAAREAGVKTFILGGGSNVLFTQDFDGLVIRMTGKSVTVVDENEDFVFLKIEAGKSWSELVDECLAKGWCGIENLALVPGTVGGAAVQNIGAYGMEAAEVIREVECFVPEENIVKTLSVDECDYGYRTSIFKTAKKDWVVTAVVLALPKTFKPVVGYKELAAFFKDKVPQSATEVADAVKAIRRKKLPDPAVIGNAGSFFKNPVVSRIKMVSLLEETPQIVSYPLAGGRAKLAAGWLIDAVGMKGKRVGDAGVYEHQALVLVNHGHATGAEIKALADEVAFVVKRRFGVVLEPEPVII